MVSDICWTHENPDGKCLNPCSNGIWSLTLYGLNTRQNSVMCLNPCSNGIWSLTHSFDISLTEHIVLILVLMEYGL